MGLAFFSETGKRISPSTATAPIVGGPWFGKPFYPREEESIQRLRFIPDLGGMPLHRAAMFGLGGANATNLIKNPRFQVDDTGWAADRFPLGGMFGGPGCGIITDGNTAVEQHDGFYTYDKGSAIGTTGVFFGLWVRPIAEPYSTITANWVSIKLVVQDDDGTTTVTSAAFQRLYSSHGWTWCHLVIPSRAWTGNKLKAGIMFKNPGNLNSLPMFVDGAILCTGFAANAEQAIPYHDGDHGGSAWSGTIDASTSTVAAARYLQWDITNVPYSQREGFVSCCAFPAFSPLGNGYDGAIGTFGGYRVATIGTTGNFNPFIHMLKKTTGDGYTVTATVGSVFSPQFTADLANWPQCPMQFFLSWTDKTVTLGIRGHFSPAAYGLASNIYLASADSERGMRQELTTALSVTLGAKQDGSSVFSGYIQDFNFGNRGMDAKEVLGVLQQGPGPYTGTVAWAPLDENRALFLIDAVSFHKDGPLGLARDSYSPDSGLVAVAGTGRPSSDLTRAVTENVVDSFGVVGRLGDVQLTQRAVSALSALFEQVHRNNESGARYASGVVYSQDIVQAVHPHLRTFPAAKALRSQLVWGDIDLDPRLSGPYGHKGKMWGTVRYERWGFWQGPSTRLPLSKTHAAALALTYTTENFNDDSGAGTGTSDKNYFEIPEGLAEGDLEGPCQMYLRSPVSSVLSRVRLARRSRGIPGDVLACYEAESANNTFGGTGAEENDANQSGANVRSSTNTSATFFDWIKFEVVNADSAIPDWLFGEWRILAVVAPQSGGTDLFYLRARVDMGASFQGPYGPTLGTGSTSGSEYHIYDLGIFKIPSASVPRGLTAVGGSAQGLSVVLQVKEATASLDIFCDCIMLMPADECYVQVDRNGSDAAVGSGGLLISSIAGQDQAVMLDASDRFEDIAILRARGVYVQPGRKNRFWLLVDNWDSTRYESDANAGATVELFHTARHLLLPDYQGGGGGGWG